MLIIKRTRIPWGYERRLKAFIRRYFPVKLTKGLEIALLRNDKMAKYNREFTGRKGTTDVLTFPGKKPVIMVNVELAIKRAIKNNVKAEDEITKYIVHGLLHLMGYEHYNEQLAKEMQAKEEEYMRLWKSLET